MHDTARHNMIEQQLRTWEVLDDKVLALYADQALARENFIADADKKGLAYADMALPIGGGQYMLEPKLEGRMLQTLAPAAAEKILHIGTGSGFFAALLGRLAAEVISIEIRPDLAQVAAIRLAAVAGNVRVIVGDGSRGWPEYAPYDAIVLTGAVAELTDDWLPQLTDSGRLLAVVGRSPAMILRLLSKDKGGVCIQRDILETDIPLLDNAPSGKSFSF